MMNTPHQILFGNEIKKNEIGVACGTYGDRRAAYRVLVGRSEGKRPCGRPRCRWEEHTKVGLKEVQWGGMG
jgi:hypothetical protein